MRLKKPFVARISQVKITRDGETALIEYKDKSTSSVNLHIGPGLLEMSDREVLDTLNNIIRVQKEMAAQYVHVAVEIPDEILKSSIQLNVGNGCRGVTYCDAL